MSVYLKNQAPATVKTGWAMRHKTGGDVGFSWNKDDPQFGPEWERVPMAPQQAPAKALTDEAEHLSDDEIVKALHSIGVDTYPSKYGFHALQVSATSVPTIRKIVEIFLAAQPAASVPEGWKLVPIEPTEEMIIKAMADESQCAVSELEDYSPKLYRQYEDAARRILIAGIAAAPSPDSEKP